MKYQLLQSLLPYLEEYEKAHAKMDDIQHFAVWLSRTHAHKNQESGHSANQGSDSPEVNIGKLIFFLTRYARHYSRKALEGTPVGTMDEFVYLAMLHQYGPMSKSDLIQRNRHEKPTGMDIIKRLLALEFIGQEKDLEDRRSKLVAITDKGMQVLMALYGKMGLVSHVVAGNLSKSERLNLVQLLEKLEIFHQILLAKTKNEAFEGIIKAVADLGAFSGIE
ncbi:MAG: winged helix DNA-binding protein [Bacteroidetes bacterium]|nr:winged helix DNA-binding protein [Bacteroidota bacterium]